ncbi:amidohydrolase [Microbacterium shaanxiense]
MTMNLILLGGRVDGEQPERAAAVGISAGLIAAIGSREDASRWALAPDGVVLDLGESTIVAGLSDPHSHPIHGLPVIRGIDLTTARNRAALVEAIADEAARREPGEWLLGWGLHPDALEGPADSAAIDDAAPDHPVFVRFFDFHAGIANTRAMREAGVHGSMPLEGSASVVVDPDGVPTGLLQEMAAMELVLEAMPPLAELQRRADLRTLFEGMASTGLTATHSLSFDPSCIDLLTELEREAPLPLRVRLSPAVREEAGGADIEDIIALHGTGGRDWSVEGAKFFLDGTIDNGTAWLSSPDSHGESNASIWSDVSSYASAVARLHAAGIPTATHAIGDAAVAYALDALEALPPGLPGLRHRIEHVETVDAELVRRFAASGVIASMQPAHAVTSIRADGEDEWSRRLGARAADAFPARSIMDAGGTVAFGSDWPIGTYDPREIMAMARLRRMPGSSNDPVRPEQAATARQALDGYTRAVALIHGTAHLEGSVQVGYRADLTVFASDPLEVAADELPELSVLATVVSGRLSFAHPSLAGGLR